MAGVYDESDWFTARQIVEVVGLYCVPGHRTSVSGMIRWIKEQQAGLYGWWFNGNTARWYGEYRGATAYHWRAFLFDGALSSALQEEAARRRKLAGEVKQRDARAVKWQRVDKPKPALDLLSSKGDLAGRLAADAGILWLPELSIRETRIVINGVVSFGNWEFRLDALEDRHGEWVSVAANADLPMQLWVFTEQSRWRQRRYIQDGQSYIGCAWRISRRRGRKA